MKPGRPTSHIKARYISWNDGETQLFYALDSKGNLERVDRKICVHHSRQIQPQPLPSLAEDVNPNCIIDDLIPGDSLLPYFDLPPFPEFESVPLAPDSQLDIPLSDCF